ncbi:choline dehydrogenase-like flavoprotein [Neolewinella xylanilytica]|uniref:Choline dehydrogenase-like flavoprotein n=1 Tax=Neolewinella xylanilytica TaxID=1514080 RepID=A0A2S6I244_9BACT|nr:GMC family oxidoreductase [Neolewinella xylanilytica]PPK85161.1 choline dehydrogenase-like flavoprotein [Neolewinella xylanilytica]
MKFNSQGDEEVTYDAIVVGTGISGGWAAMELTKKGLKTLVLEKGRMVQHGDYPTANLDTWDFENLGRVAAEEIQEHYPKQNRTGYTVSQQSKHWFVKDSEHPYSETERFDWMRGYHVGGRSIMWGRHSYRWSDLDFQANARDGIATPWPVGYADIDPWYTYVETFAGISGEKLGLSQLPDGNFLPMMPLNCVEDQVRKGVAENMGGRVVTAGRVAHLTAYDPSVHLGTRGACQFRNRCIRGCPYGGYFSSVSSTIPVAQETGLMTLRPNSSVYSLIYDKENKRAKGVRFRDTETGEDHEAYSKVVFLCASAIPSSYIVMNTEHEEGVTMDTSGELGGNVMDHHFRVGANGVTDDFGDKIEKGRKPNGVYIPRYQNLGDRNSKKDYLRGFGYQGGAGRGGWGHLVREMNVKVGPELKDALIRPGKWNMGLTAFAETLPDTNNRMTLDRDKLDKDGLPTLNFNAKWGENEYAMVDDMMNDAAEMLEAAGMKDVSTYNAHSYPGLGIHEMGMARMGSSPSNSVVDKYNRLWAAPNVYMTDGAFMTSAACVNPSLTYMAFTARAADHAVNELKKMNI